MEKFKKELENLESKPPHQDSIDGLKLLIKTIKMYPEDEDTITNFNISNILVTRSLSEVLATSSIDEGEKMRILIETSKKVLKTAKKIDKFKQAVNKNMEIIEKTCPRCKAVTHISKIEYDTFSENALILCGHCGHEHKLKFWKEFPSK